MKRIFAGLLLASQLAYAETPNNIIMIVADGMGPEYTTAYRYLTDDKATPIVERTIFDKHLVGSSSTYPASVSGYVTDSAASATALSTGVKTYNGAIAVDLDKQPLETVLERAKAFGYKTGAVVTSQVNHATPASYIAHNEQRRNYNAIADSYVDDKINNQVKFDVLFGGGWKYFLRDDRNLVEELKQFGFQYIDNYNQLNSFERNKPVLGLFADVGLPYAIDDTKVNRLADMTKAALPVLENEKGFFLLIEASQVDWAGHSNDITAAMSEMRDLAATLEFLDEYTKSHPDTLVILTADHSTGGMTLAANGKYEWDPTWLNIMPHSPVYVSKHFRENKVTKESLEAQLKVELTVEEVELLKAAKLKDSNAVSAYDALTTAQKKEKRKPMATYNFVKQLQAIIDIHTNTGWTTGGHIAIDVPVFAFGPSSEQFKGSIDNTDIAKKIFTLLKQ